MTQKLLPVGIQTFRKVIEGNYLYVDKTRLIYNLIHSPSGVYFISRPRRFGKSLLLSTIAEIFAGNKELFRGLWLYDSSYSWKTHPVIHIDFSLERANNALQLELIISQFLQEIAATYGLTLSVEGYQAQFRELIQQLATRNKATILIDEYDKPILDNIDDTTEAKAIRDVLKGFYGVINW